MIIKKESEQIISYLEDTSNLKIGNADVVYIPKNEAEVLQTIKEARKTNMSLTASGAGTGTTGGRIPLSGAVISLEKMNNIVSIPPAPDTRLLSSARSGQERGRAGDKKNSTAVLQSGVIVDDFLKALDGKKLFYPPFPTERMAFIGSNVATNASGEYSFRFGATRKYVERIKVALSTENILDIKRGEYIADEQGIITSPFFKVKIPSYRSPNIKNAAGYFSKPGMDLIDLFIGSEGTLGIITEVELKLIPALPTRCIMIIFLEKDEGIIELLNRIKTDKELNVYSLEYFEEKSLGILKKAFPNIPSCRAALYIEQEKKELDRWLEILSEYELVDTWIGENERDYNKLINFRHKLPELINEYFREIKQTKVSLDIAVPEDYFPTFLNFYREMAKTTAVEYVIFGHIGENHLHFNFFPKNEQERERAIASYVEAVKRAVAAGGTVSAEHGIGKLKHKYLEMMYGREGIMEMVRIKKRIDPFCLFGLNNIFPKELLQD